METSWNLLEEEEKKHILSLGQDVPKPELQILYLCYVDLKFVKQWHLLEIKRKNHISSGIFECFFIEGKHHSNSDVEIIVPTLCHNQLSFAK